MIPNKSDVYDTSGKGTFSANGKMPMFIKPVATPQTAAMNQASLRSAIAKAMGAKQIQEDPAWDANIPDAATLAQYLHQAQGGNIPPELATFLARYGGGGSCGPAAPMEGYKRKGYRLSEDPQWTSGIPDAATLANYLSQVTGSNMPPELATFLAQYQGGGGSCGPAAAMEGYKRKGYRLSEDPQWTSGIPDAAALAQALSQVTGSNMPPELATFLAQYQGGGGSCGPAAAMEDYMSSLFNGENLSEDFKFKTKTIFEAAINERVSLIENNILSASKEIIEEQVIANTQQIVEQVDQYLNYVISEWMEENKVAVERGLRTEIAENFINGLKDLFESSFIDVPQEKYNVLDDLFEANNELKENLNGLMKENISLKNEINARLCAEAFMEETSGLADTQVEKLAKLAEGIEFENPDQYRRKVSLLKESYFGVKNPNKQVGSMLTEDMDSSPVLTENTGSDPFVSTVANTISVLNKNTPKVEKVYNSPSSARLAGLINPGIAKDSFI
jgi:hypothetical protein